MLFVHSVDIIEQIFNQILSIALYIRKMQGSENQVSAVILLEMENVMMHRFVQGTKSLFTSGNCKMAKIQNTNSNTVFFMNINSFYYTLNKNISFIRLEYSETVSYLFPHFDNGMSAITLVSHSPNIPIFETIIQNSAKLITFQTAIQDQSLKAKIQQHCSTIKNQQIYCPDKVKQVITESGKYLGYAFSALGGLMSKGVSATGQFIGSYLSEGHTELAPETKQKWEDLKKGTNRAFSFSKDLLTTYVAPVIQKGAEYAETITQNIKKSENSNVIYARQIASTSGKALNQAFEGFSIGAKQVAGQVGNQGKKLITKKFGQDVLQTITGETEIKQLTDEKQPLIHQNEKKQQPHSENIYPKLDESNFKKQ